MSEHPGMGWGLQPPPPSSRKPHSGYPGSTWWSRPLDPGWTGSALRSGRDDEKACPVFCPCYRRTLESHVWSSLAVLIPLLNAARLLRVFS